MDCVRRRIEADGQRAARFETHTHRDEILEAEARLVAAGNPHLRRCGTDLATLLGLGHDAFIKFMGGARVMPMDIVASMQWAGRRVPEAKEWCIALARELVAPFGWTLTPPTVEVDLVLLFSDVDNLASQAAGRAMHAMADGKIDAKEAGDQLPDVAALRKRVEELESSLRAKAASVPPMEKTA